MKLERKLIIGLTFEVVGAGLIVLALVMFRHSPENVPAIVAAVAAAIASLAGGILTLMYGYKAEYQAKAGNGNTAPPAPPAQ